MTARDLQAFSHRLIWLSACAGFAAAAVLMGLVCSPVLIPWAAWAFRHDLPGGR